MKKIELILLVIGFYLMGMGSTVATQVVPAYNEMYCSVTIDQILPVVRHSKNEAHLFKTSELMRSIEKWSKNFKLAGDAVIANNTQPLCVGLLMDAQGPNAVAVGQDFILMGVNLIDMISQLSGSDLVLKMSTEKFVLAHEYAHFIQNIYGLEFDYILPMLSTKIKEQHADCMASFILQINNELSDQKIPDLELFIETLADAHIVGDHGTSEQRLQAFRSGSTLAKLHKGIGLTALTTTALQAIQRCGHYYQPTAF